MPMPFQKPSHLIGRYAVVKPWPDIQAAEDENIARLSADRAARDRWLACYRGSLELAKPG